MMQFQGVSHRLHWKMCSLILVMLFCLSLAQSQSHIFHINPNKETSSLDGFWKSTGFCPPDPHNASSDWFLSESMTQNLIYIGSLPNNGIRNVRIHFLLEAATISGFNKSIPVYDFTKLDSLISSLWSNGLKPGFEIMGNPSAHFSDFENNTQVTEWRRLVYLIASRYISLYGLSYVQQWNFESWNEPSHHAFDTINMTIQGFLNYYDACDIGLRDAHPSLILGAPGGELKDEYSSQSFSWALLNHIASGKHYFTGEKGIRVDYISIHKKGEEPNNTAAIFDKELNTLNLIKIHIPELKDKPIYNDEADPLVTWSRDRWWRQDVTYAAMVVKVIVSHQKLWLDDPGNPIKYRLLSNDNGFLSYNPSFFSQRTLLARFQMNNTMPHHVQMIRKPVYTAMALLSYMGEIQVAAQSIDAKPGMSGIQDVDILASVHHPEKENGEDSWQMAAILYNSVDSHNTTGSTNVTVYIRGVENGTSYTDCMRMVYLLDNSHGNPVITWEKAGRPKTPTWQQLIDMRANEEPARLKGPSPMDMSQDQKMSLSLSLPAVALIHVCAKPPRPPNQVAELTIHPITAGQVLLYWDDSTLRSKCLRTYEVEYSPTPSLQYFARVNPMDSVFNLFVFAPYPNSTTTREFVDASVKGYYRVRAVDYWGREGAYSPIAKFG